MITPFKNGNVDYVSLGRILKLQQEAKVAAILILGTTGESACIKEKERSEIIEFCRKRIADDCKLIVGTGANCTEKATRLTQNAQLLGADGALIVTPYYNKCTQKGLVKHYNIIAKNCDLPIIIYNVPSRTGVNIQPETALALSKIKNVVGLKEANGDINHVMNVLSILDGKMAVYSGNDNLNFLFVSQGGSGAISVTSNIFPKILVKQHKNCKKSDFFVAKAIQEELEDLNSALFAEVNPIGIKFAASYLGLCKNELRLPLTPLSKQYRAPLQREIEKIRNFDI